MTTEPISPPVIARLAVPASQQALLVRAGIVPSITGDTRRFPRRYAVTNAILQYVEGLPALPRPREYHAIIVLDVSRSGLGFLHSEQLFPGELATAALPGGKALNIEIQWCRRLGERCYQFGAKFTGK
jgi:hypothetical protein